MKISMGMKKAAVIGIAGAMLFTWGISSVSASIVSTEKPMAGINVPLDRFVVAEVETGVVRSITGVAAVQNIAVASEQPAAQPTEEQQPVQDELKEEKDEHVKLNLNYDRLGIAKVDNYLNVRAKASKGSKVVGKLTKNAGCHIYSIKKGWAKIVSGNVKGYVKAEYLVKDEEAEQMALEVGTKVVTVKENGLRVRALPSTDSSIYSVLSDNEDFEVYREKLNAEWLEKFIAKNVKKREVKKVNYDEMVNNLGDWVCISIDNDYAFVSKEYVEISYKLKRAVKVGQLATDGSGEVSQRVHLLLSMLRTSLATDMYMEGQALRTELTVQDLQWECSHTLVMDFLEHQEVRRHQLHQLRALKQNRVICSSMEAADM